jgi:hypothetical protein
MKSIIRPNRSSLNYYYKNGRFNKKKYAEDVKHHIFEIENELEASKNILQSLCVNK